MIINKKRLTSIGGSSTFSSLAAMHEQFPTSDGFNTFTPQVLLQRLRMKNVCLNVLLLFSIYLLLFFAYFLRVDLISYIQM